MITLENYYLLMKVMAALAVVVFVTLYFVKAGYGMFRTKYWGWAISSRKAWMLMEAPAFLLMLLMCYLAVDATMDTPDDAHSDYIFRWQSLILCLLFELHYFQRSFIFPYKMVGHSKMPVLIMLMGMVFNIINALLLGCGLFKFSSPELRMSVFDWIAQPHVIIGVIIFFAGMFINMHSDRVIRHLRTAGDTAHYLPRRGFYRWVTSANYFGELVEWTGFAIAAMMPAAWLFLLWTAANLIPRAHAIHRNYRREFGDEVGSRKRIIPFVY